MQEVRSAEFERHRPPLPVRAGLPPDRVRPAAEQLAGLDHQVGDQDRHVEAVPVLQPLDVNSPRRAGPGSAVARLELDLERQAGRAALLEDLDLAVDPVVVIDSANDPLGREGGAESLPREFLQHMLAGTVGAHACDAIGCAA